MGESAVIIELERPATSAVPAASTEDLDSGFLCICSGVSGVWYVEDGQGHLVTMWRPGGWCWSAERGVIRT